MKGAIKRWWNYVPPGYFTHNGFWVIAALMILSPLLVAGAAYGVITLISSLTRT